MRAYVKISLDSDTYKYLKERHKASKMDCSFEEFIAIRLEGEYLQFKQATEVK